MQRLPLLYEGGGAFGHLERVLAAGKTSVLNVQRLVKHSFARAVAPRRRPHPQTQTEDCLVFQVPLTGEAARQLQTPIRADGLKKALHRVQYSAF